MTPARSEMGATFQNEMLEAAVAVGRLSPDTARIWFRAREPGRYVVSCREAGGGTEALEAFVDVSQDDGRDLTASVSIPQNGHSLRPLTTYRYRVAAAAGDYLVGKGRFETPPADADQAPSEFSFAVMSCNQPFDAKGRVRNDAREMIAAVNKALDRHDCKFVLMMGDQMYSDMPLDLSLFDERHFRVVGPPGRSDITDCTTDEVRALYQQRYRRFLGIPELKELMANHATYPILDDHDIVDNWGSDPAHREAKWTSLGEGARWAYHDYLSTHLEAPASTLPSSFHYEIDYGPVSIFVMDLRTQRWVDLEGHGRLFSDDQDRALDAFLDRTRRQRVIFFVLSVPPIHLPRALAAAAARVTPTGEDFSDRWSSLGHVDDRDRFIRKIQAHQQSHPRQRHILLGGDIHVGCVQEVTWEDEGEKLYQFVSSGLTNKAGRAVRLGAKMLMFFNQAFVTRDRELRGSVRLVRGVDGRKANPYGHLNIGIVNVRTTSPAGKSELEFLLYGHRGDEPVCVYQSPAV